MAADLDELYGGRLVRRRGLAYPVAVQRMGGRCGDVLTVDQDPAPVDETLWQMGQPHLQHVLRLNSRMHDGQVICFQVLVDGTVRARPSSYFAMIATCDAVRAEWYESGRSAPGVGGHRLRRRVHQVCGGDPIASGQGRAAALGVALVVTRPRGEGRCFIIGRRSQRVATDRGRWHVVPSGMLEGSGGAAVASTAANELTEELGVVLGADELGRRASVLGLAHDATRLRPDLCLRLDLTDQDLRRAEPPADGEFDAFREVQMSDEGFAAFWERCPPASLTPAAAGAVALLQDSLSSSTC